MLDDNSSLAVDLVRGSLSQLGKVVFPSCIAKILQILVHDIRRHYTIYNQLAEALQFLGGGTNGVSQIFVALAQKEIPTK